MRLTRSLALGALAALATPWPCAVSRPRLGRASSSKPTIMIGSTNFEEQAIVSNIWADVLQKAGYPVTVEPSLGHPGDRGAGH